MSGCCVYVGLSLVIGVRFGVSMCVFVYLNSMIPKALLFQFHLGRKSIETFPCQSQSSRIWCFSCTFLVGSQ